MKNQPGWAVAVRVAVSFSAYRPPPRATPPVVGSDFTVTVCLPSFAGPMMRVPLSQLPWTGRLSAWVILDPSRLVPAQEACFTNIPPLMAMLPEETGSKRMA